MKIDIVLQKKIYHLYGANQIIIFYPALMVKFWNKGKKEGEKEMSFLEHLEELRWHIIRSILAIVIFMIIAFIFKNFIFGEVILGPKSADFITNRLFCRLSDLFGWAALCINQKDLQLINIKMSGQITTHITASIVAGLIAAFPFIIREFWQFFRPALKETEARYTRGAVFASSALFFFGVLFGYFLLAPLSIHFLGSYEIDPTIANQINVRSYIGTLTSICLATGLIFELPIVAFFLTKIGVITPAFMRKYRKHSIVVVFIVSAIITPPDVFSQTLVAIPLLLLYEASILISARVMKKKEKDYQEFMNDSGNTDNAYSD